MSLTQSPHIPAEGKKPGWSDLPWLATYALRALFELVRARIIFTRLEAKAIPLRNQASKAGASDDCRTNEAMLARITYVIPRLSDRLPWRSDCLIQAVAAQNWLMASRIPSEIRIGVENPKDGEFGAHAWLVHGERVITGGDIARYQLLLGASGPDSESPRRVPTGKTD